jgi:hypothetical protein
MTPCGTGEFSDSGLKNTETLRDLKNGHLQMALRTWGATDSNAGTGRGTLRLRLNNPAGLTILFVQASMTQVVDGACPANPASNSPRLGLFGAFFNDGSSRGPGDETGDALATLRMVQDSSTGPEFLLQVFRCSDPGCGTTTNIGSVSFTKIWVLNEVHSLLLFWDKAHMQFTGIVDFNTAGQESHSIAYALADGNAPGFDFKEIRDDNFVPACMAGAKQGAVFAVFDNFFAQ